MKMYFLCLTQLSKQISLLFSRQMIYSCQYMLKTKTWKICLLRRKEIHQIYQQLRCSVAAFTICAFVYAYAEYFPNKSLCIKTVSVKSSNINTFHSNQESITFIIVRWTVQNVEKNSFIIKTITPFWIQCILKTMFDFVLMQTKTSSLVISLIAL